MLELLKMLVLIAAGAAAIRLLTRTMTPNRIQKQLAKELEEAEETDEA